MTGRIERKILQTLRAIQLAALGGDLTGYVCEKVFIACTGLQTKEQRRYFRQEHPDLVKANNKGSAFIYDLDGYFKLFN